MCTYIWYQYINLDVAGNPDKPNHLRRSVCRNQIHPNPVDMEKNQPIVQLGFMCVYIHVYLHTSKCECY